MKKNGLFIPLLLALIVLFLVIATSIKQNVFKRTPAEVLQLSKRNSHIIDTAAIRSMTSEQMVILELGVEKIMPAFPSNTEIKSLTMDMLLSAEVKSLLSNNKKKKILFSLNLSDAVKAWTFLTRMGYNEVYIFDPDSKTQTVREDSILLGNEGFQYSFKPEKTEAE